MSSSVALATQTSFWDWTKTHNITGKLVHPNGDAMTDQKVKIYAPGFFWNTQLGEATTGKHGKFNLDIKISSTGILKNTHLILKVFEESVASEKNRTEREIASHKFKLPNNADKFDIGELKVSLYEPLANLPMLELPSNSSLRPQHATIDFYKELLEKGIYKVLKGIKFSLFEGWSSINDVVKAFPPRGKPLSPTSSTTIDLVLNGIYPCHFRKGSHDNELVNEINWDKYEREATPDIPNATITLENRDGKLHFKSVEIQYPGKEVEKYSRSSEGYHKALHLYNSMALLKGEAVYHLGIGHLITGQIALAFFRSINNHPTKQLIGPHLDGVAEINRLGAGLIFGENGILNVSGLTSKGVDQLLDDTLAAFDPATFKPRAPITEDHRFANAQLLYWDAVTKTVDTFFEENKEAISSPEHWYEVYNMSKFLTENSRPYRPFDNDGVMKDAPWDDPSEFDSPNLKPRVEHDGHLRAIRPITTSENAPEEGDIERLKQFCRYTMFLSTFYHWVIHTSQFQWMTNLKVGSLAPENHAKEPYGGIKPLNAVRQLQVASILVDFEAPALVDNPFGVIYQPFIDNILARKEEFNALGYDIEKMHYGVII